MSDNHPFAIADDVDDLKLREQQPDTLGRKQEVQQTKHEKAAGTDGKSLDTLDDVRINIVADSRCLPNKLGIPFDNEVAGDRAKSVLWVNEVKSFCYNASIVGLPGQLEFQETHVVRAPLSGACIHRVPDPESNRLLLVKADQHQRHRQVRRLHEVPHCHFLQRESLHTFGSRTLW
jgi:hypothetical protein